MKRYFLHTNIKKIALIVLILTLTLNGFITYVSTEPATTQISVQPSNQTVGQEDVLLPTLPFTISVVVEDVVDLYAWQVRIYYDSTILRTKPDWVWLPPDHVFDYTTDFYALPEAEIGNDTNGWYLQYGVTLMGEKPVVSTFDGSGTLFKMNFTGIKPGTSFLRFSRPLGEDTFLWNYSSLFEPWVPIDISVVDGSVTVLGIERPRESSSISINAYPSTAVIGSDVTINGTINPARDGADVTIFSRSVGGTWTTPATVKTDTLGNYNYTWTTTKADEFELYASWLGDEYYEGAQSSIITVTVNKRTSTISLNIYPTNVTAGSSVTINGTVTPKPTPPFQPGEGVTIFSFRVGATWTELATVYLDENGVYKYVWKPDEGGLYEIKASWSGDETTLPADSKVKTIEVTGEAPPPEAPSDIMVYLPYIVAALVIIAIATGVIYFTKIRKS